MFITAVTTTETGAPERVIVSPVRSAEHVYVIVVFENVNVPDVFVMYWL